MISSRCLTANLISAYSVSTDAH